MNKNEYYDNGHIEGVLSQLNSSAEEAIQFSSIAKNSGKSYIKKMQEPEIRRLDDKIDSNARLSEARMKGLEDKVELHFSRLSDQAKRIEDDISSLRTDLRNDIRDMRTDYKTDVRWFLGVSVTIGLAVIGMMLRLLWVTH